MTLAQDLLDRFAELQRYRFPFERHWRDVDSAVGTLTRRDVYGIGSTNDYEMRALSTRRREKSQTRYDTTMQIAVDRLTAGLLSLTFPNSQKWHTLTTASVEDMEDEQELRWAQSVRDLLFFNRYASYSGFESAIQRAIGSMIRYGPGYLYIEPSFSPKTAMRYCHIPTDEGFIARDEFGIVDTFAQQTTLKARQAMQKAVKNGWKVSDKIKADAEDPKLSGREHTFVKIVLPREERGIRGLSSMRNAPWACYTIEKAQKLVVKEEGFETFPVACFFWDELGQYGTSPCVNYILEHKMLSAMERDVLLALQQMVRPAYGVHDNSLFNRPNLNPGAINPGMVTADGRPLMLPLATGGNPERIAPFLQQRRDQLNDGFYTRLFQVLEDRQGQTATEVLIRNQEKSDLLGPIGARLHMGAGVMIDREMEALEIRGLYADDSPYLPPESLADKDIRPQYTNPMQKLAMAGEAEGVIRMMEIDNIRIQSNRPALLRDAETGQFLAEAFNAPMRLVKTSEELAAEAQGLSQAAQEQQAVSSATAIANAAPNAIEALNALPAE